MITHRRLETENQLDFYPTPPWATRALFHHVLDHADFHHFTCWEPAAGRGDMAKVLANHFKQTIASDIAYYGNESILIEDFLTCTKKCADWIITNPPFNLADTFINLALMRTPCVAMFTRLQLMEGKGRYELIFKDRPPTIIAPFVERVQIEKNRVVRKSGSTTAYAWFIWWGCDGDTNVKWIPPCKRELERDEDYD